MFDKFTPTKEQVDRLIECYDSYYYGTNKKNYYWIILLHLKKFNFSEKSLYFLNRFNCWDKYFEEKCRAEMSGEPEL